MSPILWLCLMLMFCFVGMLMNCVLYFSYVCNFSSSSKMLRSSSMSLKF